MLEDIHWADEMSVRLLFYLGRRLKTVRVLLAGTFRDDELPQGSVARGMLEDFEREWPTAQIALPSLSRSDAVVLAHAIAKADAPSTILEQLGAHVWELSQGNPFMIVDARLAQCSHAAGEPERGKEYARRAILAGEASGDTIGPALARSILAEILHFEGHDEETIAVARRNLAGLSGARVSRYFGHSALPSVSARMYLVWSLARRGEFPEALRYANEALGIAESGDRPFTLSQACYAVGGAYLTRGDLAMGIPVLERGRQLSLARVHGHRSGFRVHARYGVPLRGASR
jgi:ATP/maltotriose-dependent transcriptional regulator MalT